MTRATLTTLILALAVTLAACGKKAKPAAAPHAITGAQCCCEYVKESGSEEDGTWAENQTSEMLPKVDCEGLSGSCVTDANCAGDAPDEE